MNEPSLPPGRDAVLALLEWYSLAGVRSLARDEPRDRFAETAREVERRNGQRSQSADTRGKPSGRPEGAKERPIVEASTPAAARAAAVPSSSDGLYPSNRVAVPDDLAIADAREGARSARILADLRSALEAFDGCNLRVTARTTVFGDGAEDADVMFVGEAPGREEDTAGVPFVGKSGQLLDRMLAAIGLERQAVRVTNTVPWRPPGNRPPTPAETAICLPFVQRHIELVRPKVLVCLGSPSAKAILGAHEGILRVRGKWTGYSFGMGDGETLHAIAMLHPAYLLRQPAQKKLAWRDLLSLREKLSELG